MQAQDWATLSVSLVTIIGAFIASVRWLVKHYLSELKNNGGSSIKDQVDRLEVRVDTIIAMLGK
jgi:flagellar biogenesis protein FliO